MLGSENSRCVVSAPIPTAYLLYWMGLIMAGIMCLCAVPEMLFGSEKSVLFLLSFAAIMGTGSCLSRKLSHIILQNGEIRLATLTGHRVVSQAEFVRVQSIGMGIMRMDFLVEKPAYFFLNTRVLMENDQETVSSNQMKNWLATHSIIASMTAAAQASFLTKRINDYLNKYI